MGNVSQILFEIENGDRQAANQLLPLVYNELRQLAAKRLALEPAGQSLEATALVHEAYLRLVITPRTGQAEPAWNNRGHFFGAAAEAMRRILVENARRKSRIKHGGDRQRVALDDQPAQSDETDEKLLALDEALTKFAAEDPEAAKVVQLHHFAGLSIEQIAEALGLSRATAYRHWSYARAWLRCAMDSYEPASK